ncbi:MAG: MFS transporter [Desulfobacterales bacterium]|nr:MFS transporter [Desulfobacterales bacterium]
MVRTNAFIYISAFALMFCVGLIVAVLPGKMMALTGAPADVGYLASAFALTFVLMQVPAGRLSDIFGIKNILAAGYLICGAAGLLYLYADRSQWVLGGRMLQGIGEVPVWSLAPVLLAMQHPRHKGRFIGLYNAVVHCGLTAGSLAGLLTEGYWHDDTPFLLFTGSGVLGWLMVTLWVKSPVPRRCNDQEKAAGFIPVLKDMHLQIVFTGILLYGAGYGIFITMIPGYLLVVEGVSQSHICLVFIVFYTGISIAQVTAGILSDKLGRRPLMVTGFLMASAGMILFPWVDLTWMLPLLAVAALGLGTFCVSALAWVNEWDKAVSKGVLSGVFYLYWGIGYFFGPILLGALGHPGQWRGGFVMLGTLMAVELLSLSAVSGDKGRWRKSRDSDKV